MKIIAVTRTFQPGISKTQDFDSFICEKNVISSLLNILNFGEVDKVIVLTNGDKSNHYGEPLDCNGDTISGKYIMNRLRSYVDSKRLIIKTCFNWGLNPGSTTALNEALNIAHANKYEVMYIWSPEAKISHDLFIKGVRLLSKNVDVVGFYREGWEEFLPWQVVQNTAALWRLEALTSLGGFDESCNGNQTRVFNSDTYGPVPIAGMEDFHALLRLLKIGRKEFWGMVDKDNPYQWDTSFCAGSERETSHFIKIDRQLRVMEEYAKDIFPNLNFDHVISNLMKQLIKI